MLKNHNHHQHHDYKSHYTDHHKADNYNNTDDNNETYHQTDDNRRDFTYDTSGHRFKFNHAICSHGLYMGGQHNSNWSL